MSNIIASLRVALGLDSAQFSAGNKKVRAEAKSTAASVTKSYGAMRTGVAGFLGSLSIGVIAQAARAALDYAGSLGEVAEQLGVTTRELQTFRFAAQQMGASQEEADSALGKLTLSMSKALNGSKQAVAAYRAVGISLDDLKTKSKTEIIGKIADEMKRTGGASNNAAAGVAIFGKGFQKIAPLMNQGSKGFNELADAADRLGIVLSDEQIQKADQTADKIDALWTVLQAKIAGDVADNANSILDLADAFFELIKRGAQLQQTLDNFGKNYSIPNLFKGDAFGLGTKGKSVTTKMGSGGLALAVARKYGLKLAGEGGPARRSTGNFLAGGGGSKGGRGEDPERARLEALRAANDFLQEQLRADMDILSAKRGLASDYIEQQAISIQMLDLERMIYASQLEYEVAAKEKTKAQAATLLAKYDEADALKRQAAVAEMQEQGARDSFKLDRLSLDLQQDELQAQLQLAETATERRDLELRLLDLAYEKERLAIDELAKSKNFADQEEARRRALSLNATYGADRQGVMNANRGPLGDYMASLPSNAAKMNEALEMVAANGLQSLEDGILSVIDGTKSLGDAFREMASQIIADLLRIQIQKMIVSAIGSITGAPAGGAMPGFATGGSFQILGNHGRDQNMLSLNGLPIAKVSHGERLSVSNDNPRSSGTFNISVTAPNTGDPRRDRATAMQQAAMVRREVAKAASGGY